MYNVYKTKIEQTEEMLRQFGLIKCSCGMWYQPKEDKNSCIKCKKEESNV